MTLLNIECYISKKVEWGKMKILQISILLSWLFFFAAKGCQAPIAGGPLADDLIADNQVSMFSIESKICDLSQVLDSSISNTIDINSSLIDSLYQDILYKYCSIKDSLIENFTFLNTASLSLYSIESKIDLINHIAEDISHATEALKINDFGGTWTVIQNIEDGLCFSLNQFLNSEENLKMILDVISTSQLGYFFSTCTIIESISDLLMQNMDLLDEISQSLDIATIKSCLDMLSSVAYSIESDLDTIEITKTIGFSGTYTALQELGSKVCLIDQNIHTIEDISFHISTLDHLNTKIARINSKSDTIITDFYSSCDDLQMIESLLDQAEYKLYSIDSFIDIALLKTDTLISVANNINITLGSFIDNSISLNNTIQSILCNLESSLDISFNEVFSLESRVDTIVDSSASIESIIDTQASISDLALENICDIESKIGNIDQSYITIQSTIDLYDQLESYIDGLYIPVNSLLDKTCTIASSIDSVDQHIGQEKSIIDLVISDLDIVNADIQIIGNTVNTISSLSVTMQSSVEVLDNISHTITSKVCVIETVVDNINSHLDSIHNAMNTVVNNLNIVNADFQQTWTILDTTQKNSDTINALLITIESKIDAIDGSPINIDFSGTYTALKVIEQTKSLTDSILDTIALRATDVAGTYSVLDTMLVKSCAMLENIRNTSSDLLRFSNSECIGTEITAALIGTTGYTISSSGRYFFGENINFVPTAAATMITVNANNVLIDFCGKTLSHTDSTAFTVNGISIASSLSNIMLMDGSILQMDGDSLIIGSGASNVAVTNMRILDAESNGISCVGTVTGLVINQAVVSGNGAKGISITDGTDIVIRNSFIVDNIGDAITINPGSSVVSSVEIEKCIIARNTGNGISIAGTSGQRAHILIDSCHIAANSLAGISASKTVNSVFKNNMISSNGSNGIVLSDAINALEIYDNAIINNTGRGIYVSGTNALPSSFQRNVMVVNSVSNYREDTDCGAHSVLSNYALATSEANNYSIGGGSGPTTINKAVISQGVGTFSTTPGKWRNISMTT